MGWGGHLSPSPLLPLGGYLLWMACGRLAFSNLIQHRDFTSITCFLFYFYLKKKFFYRQTVKDCILDKFAGEPKKGIFSPSVQNTLYLAAKMVLDRVEEVSRRAWHCQWGY